MTLLIKIKPLFVVFVVFFGFYCSCFIVVDRYFFIIIIEKSDQGETMKIGQGEVVKGNMA